MAQRILSKNQMTGTTTYHDYDASSNEAIITTSQDVTDIIESNKAQYNDIDERARYGDMAKVASIPMNIYFDLKKRGILNDQKKMKQWLNDPDNKYFRTRPGRV
jgi:hypothetical protein